MDARYKTYNKKCKLFCFRFRREQDGKYIKFLDDCPNKIAFIKKAIDRELGLH